MNLNLTSGGQAQAERETVDKRVAERIAAAGWCHAAPKSTQRRKFVLTRGLPPR
jgi:hypothetical protein